MPYESLPDAVWNRLAAHFGLPVADASRQTMMIASRHHSKSQVGRPTDVFVPDGERKRAEATPELRRAIDEIARPAYARLIDRMSPTA